MKPLVLSFAFFLMALAGLSPADSQEPPTDPRVQAILNEIAALQAKVTAKKEERTQKYLADLENLEKKIQTTGDLDKVLQVSSERKEWSAAQPTPTIDPKDETFILELRKLRYYFDQDLATIAATAKQDSVEPLAAFEQRFRELEKLLTTEGKIPQAVEARRMREQLADGTLPAKLLETEKPERPIMTEAPAETKTESEIVAVHQGGRVRGIGQLSEGRKLDLSPLEPYDDFVKVSGSKDTLLFLRANGEVLDEQGSKVGEAAVKLINFPPLAGFLDEEGIYHSISSHSLPTQEPLRQVINYSGRILIVTRSGELIGDGAHYRSGARVIPSEATKGIVQVTMTATKDYALTEEGIIHAWDNEGTVERPDAEDFEGKVKLMTLPNNGWDSFVVTTDKQVHQINGKKEPLWKDSLDDPTVEFIAVRRGLTFILGQDNRWQVLTGVKPSFGEKDILTVVMNQETTLDVDGLVVQNKDKELIASYAIWIEEPGIEPLDLSRAPTLARRVKTQAAPEKAKGFFGYEAD